MKSISLISNVILFSLLALPQQVFAQQPPEAQRMDWLVGDWKYEDLDGGAKCKWLGDFTIHCESSWTNNAGETTEAVFLTRYDPEAKIYTAHRFYSGGYTDSGLGWVDGDTWSFVYEGPAGDRYRFTGVISEDTWTYEWHSSVKGGSWERTAGGSMKKVQ
ncbi:MAG: hypothetical protein OEQ53_13240 [Saprospiraceae bacterium]|nr:hypothetical protein [Saprospiraceae bacterium]